MSYFDQYKLKDGKRQVPEQEPKTGHWVDLKYHQLYNGGSFETAELMCSYCSEVIEWDIKSLHKPYSCPNCNARMIESQESEDEEAIATINHILEVSPKEPPIECDCVDEWLHEDERMRKALDMAIKALKQKPVLDRIRYEIKEMTPTYHNSDWSITDLVSISEVLKLIDKHMVESEKTDAGSN